MKKATIALIIVAAITAGCSGRSGSDESIATPGIAAFNVLAPQMSATDAERLRAVVEGAASKVAGTQAAIGLVDDEASLQSALASARPPTVWVTDGLHFPDLAGERALQPWPAGSEFGSDLPEALRSAFARDGALQCAPRDISPLVLVYATQMFRDAEVPEPSPGWTWEELRATAEALTDLEQGEYGLISPLDITRWLPFLYQAGGRFTDPTLTRMELNSAEAISALDFFLGLYREGIAATPADVGAAWAGEALGRGRAAMVIEGPWIVSYLRDSFPDLEFGAIALPSGAAGNPTLAFSTCYGLPTGELGADALAFATALLEASALRQWAGEFTLPSRSSLLAEIRRGESALVPWADAVDGSNVLLFAGGFDVLAEAFSAAAHNVIDGVMTSAEALAEIERTGNDLLAVP